MAWTKPLNGRSRVDLAGAVISGRRKPDKRMEVEEAIDISGNWRSSHGYPLHVAWKALQRRAKKFDSRALVPKRIKRLPSIILKLFRFKTMQLSQMNDLGGCRAILRSVGKAEELVRFYHSHPCRTLVLVRSYDYIASPKKDGYRSIHLVYKYVGSHEGEAYKNLRIEIQIRSQLQHVWATAVEVIDTFAARGLKSNLANDAWRRFFALVASAMAMTEKRSLVPGTPTNISDLVKEIKALYSALKVHDVFLGISTGLEGIDKRTTERPFKPEAYILTLNSKKKQTMTVAYASYRYAEEDLLKIEKRNLKKPHLQSVMASANSIAALRSAYPNYYLNTSIFTVFIEDLMEKKPE